jgi:hypothetical protein
MPKVSKSGIIWINRFLKTKKAAQIEALFLIL